MTLGECQQRHTIQLKVLLTPAQKEALDEALRKAQELCPLIPLTTSDMIRQWIVDAANACPQCDGPTKPDPARPGARYCERCGEAVLYQPPTPGGDGDE